MPSDSRSKKSKSLIPRWLIRYQGVLDDREGQEMEESAAPVHVTIRALPMLVPESVVQHDAEKKRVKKGILGGFEERFGFGETLYLPYLEFTYQYSSQKGFLSKQNSLAQARAVGMALP